jgi:hypothetical protein
MDLDDLLPHVGEFGRYQKLLVWLVCLPACIPCGFCAFNQLFMADVPDHWCYVPELMDLPGIGPLDRRQLAIPTEVSDLETLVSSVHEETWLCVLIRLPSFMNHFGGMYIPRTSLPASAVCLN